MPADGNCLTRDAFLGGLLQINQPRLGYRATADAVFLAAACPAERGQTVLELGCGAGTAILCLGKRTKALHLTGVELQPDYCALARQNADENAIPLNVVEADLANLPQEISGQSFDHVILNPPFFTSGTRADNSGRARARKEDTPLEMWIDAALKRCAPKGHITLIHLAERLPDILALLRPRAGALEIKPLASRANRPASRIIVRAKKGSRSPATLYNPLILHKGDAHDVDRDSYADAAKAILRRGEPLIF
ncbi:tRNA1(Val) (adenine(37)-N6)-methyltransferase [Litoreibacter roseus]|uniref:Methyltransferase n=1 Tax=Litoreibacter roseus TaxID=2601869 RepID=A0A6N6JJ64_9RHOB|nr:methyltransferase domain-containing protein [Litoreibacter roseus]GFE66371.1 methyltransferase [Litoreibacter roseus]